MVDDAISSVLITGSSSGIGQELAGQLGARSHIERVVLACRNPAKAEMTRAALEARTGRDVFETLSLDTSDLSSARSAGTSLAGSIDAVVLNAGGSGGPCPTARSTNGAMQAVTVNVLGHAALLETLIKLEKLKRVAVMTGSEAARGVPMLLINQPNFRQTSVDEVVSAIDGSYFTGRRFGVTDAYALSKCIGAQWMAAMARRNPHLRFVTMSPGGTSGTSIGLSMPTFQRLAFERIVMGPIGRRLGFCHSLPEGAARLALAVLDPAFGSGKFYASRAERLTGPVVDQGKDFGDFANSRFQDNAYEAVARFLSASSATHT